MRGLSIFSLAAACFGAAIAYVTYWVGCFAESYGSTTCPDGNPTAVVTWQLVLGLIGVIPAFAFVFFSYKGPRWAALTALAIGIALWIAWGFLNDASVHGRDAVLPFLRQD